MTTKRMQNTHDKAKLEWSKISKLINKCYASIPPHSNLTKSKKYQQVTKTKTR